MKQSIIRLRQLYRYILSHPTLKRWISITALLAVYALVILVIASSWHEAVAYMQQVRVEFLIAAFLCYLFSFILHAIVWNLLINRLSGNGDTIHHLWVYCYNVLIRRLPGSWWYVLGRTEMNQSQGISPKTTLIATLYEFTLLLGSSVVVLVASLAFIYHPVLLLPAGLALFTGFSLSVRSIFRFVARRHLREQEDKLPAISLLQVIIWVTLYSLSWLSGSLLLILVIQSVYALTITQMAWLVAIMTLSTGIGVIVSSLPVGGWGRDISLIVLLSKPELIGIPIALAVPGALVLRLYVIAGDCVCASCGLGILYLIRSRRAKPTRHIDPSKAA